MIKKLSNNFYVCQQITDIMNNIDKLCEEYFIQFASDKIIKLHNLLEKIIVHNKKSDDEKNIEDDQNKNIEIIEAIIDTVPLSNFSELESSIASNPVPLIVPDSTNQWPNYLPIGIKYQ